MSEQGTTKDLSMQQENERICERLLGWIRHDGVHAYPAQAWLTRDGHGAYTPTFTTPDEAELIAQSLIARRLCIKMEYKPWDGKWNVRIQTPEHTIAGGEGRSWQEALRAAVVRFIDLVEHPWPSESHDMRALRAKVLELPA